MLMDTAAFDSLLAGDIGTRLRWMASHRCPCVLEGRGADPSCSVCDGLGNYWDSPSVPFRAGLLALSQQDLGRLQNKMGEGAVGDASLSLPSSAPCYGKVKVADRFLAVDAIDTVEWLLSPRAPVRLPVGAVVRSVLALSSGKVVATTLPDADEYGRITVLKASTVAMLVPRLYEIVADAGRIRAWQTGMPQKFALQRIDVTTR